MVIIGLLALLLKYSVSALVLTVIILMVLRFAVNYADLNPFGWFALNVRRYSDPLVGPVQWRLRAFGLDAKFAPLVTVLITILAGWFFLSLTDAVLVTAVGVIKSLQRGAVLALIGYLLYGLLAVYSLLIIMRVIFSWGLSEVNPLMRWLVRVTDPVLVPFRRLIPPLGTIDISPIIVIFLLQLFQKAIAGTLLG